MNLETLLVGLPWVVLILVIGFNLLFLHIWNRLYHMVRIVDPLIGERTAQSYTLYLYEKLMEGGTFPTMRRLTVSKSGNDMIIINVKRDPAYNAVSNLASWIKYMPCDLVRLANMTKGS